MNRPSPHTREERRLINRRQQGDLGEASAIEWLTRQGATVWAPLGHSPDADLIADVEGTLLRVQVKTSTCRSQTPNGHLRWEVSLATNGGNQSWSGVAKVFDPSRFDVLFALTGDGRRWFVPANAIEAATSIRLGGTKYSEFEIEPTSPIEHLVYCEARPLLESNVPSGEYPSGQRTRSVKPWAYAFTGSNPVSPICISAYPQSASIGNGDTTGFERSLGRVSQVIMRPKRQMTMPKRPYVEAGLDVGDRMRVRAECEGRVVFERILEPADGSLRLPLNAAEPSD
jgi:hypothetical protein